MSEWDDELADEEGLPDLPGPLSPDAPTLVITANPNYPHAPLPAFPKYLQIKNEGADLGDRGVRVIDFVFNPATYSVTRGVGENSHIITLRKLPVVVPEIGWAEGLGEVGGTVAHANSGTGELGFTPLGTGSGEFYAGVVGYSGQSVVWSVANWDPAVPLTPEPTLTDMGSGVVRVTWPVLFLEPDREGSLILTATIDGTPVPIGQRLVVVAGPDTDFDGYANFAWGPE